MCRSVFCSSTSTCGVFCVELTLLLLYFAASIPCAQTVEASPHGPWTVITIRHLFVKMNDAYVRFIAQSVLPLAASDFNWKLAGCTLDRKQCLYFRRLMVRVNHNSGAKT